MRRVLLVVGMVLLTCAVLFGEAVLIAALTSNPEGPIIGFFVGCLTTYMAMRITTRLLKRQER